MTFVSGYECTLCHKIYPSDANTMTCPSCGETGILDVLYDYKAMKQVIDKDYFQTNHNYSIFRYQPMMSIEPPVTPTLQVGWTPLYRSTHLETTLGIKQLYLKDETVNPTGSLKDRASIVACLNALEQGYDTICCSSTGNAASSLAGNAAKLGLKTIIAVPKRAPIGKLTQLILYGSNVIQVDGDYKDAFQLSKDLIDRYGLYNRNAAINPHLVEGKKTVILESIEQMDFHVPDYVFVSVGDGCTIGGVYKGLYDLMQLNLINKMPRIIGVQAEGCAPFYHAFSSGEPLRETEEHTFADSIAVGIPRNPIKGMNAVTKSNGIYLTVSDDEIRDAMRLLGQQEGIFAEPAGATALAGLRRMMETKHIPSDASVLVLVTGNGLKDPSSVEQVVRQQTIKYHPDTDHDILHQTRDPKQLLQTLTERRNHHE